MHNKDLEEKKVVIYTDGACKGNPGRGGYGAVLLYKLKDKIYRKELSAGYKLTTNNRMELLGVIMALKRLKKTSKVVIYSDSKYIIDAIKKKWLLSWKKNNWKNSQKKSVKNKDLWLELDKLLDFHDVSLVWVRGHTGVIENEKCDKLAVDASNSDILIEDRGYNDSNN
jgi:ribonuclease HI